MNTPEEIKEFYDRLKNELDDTTTFPGPYLYKFIVPSQNDKVAEIMAFFDGTDAEITTKTSSNGKYTSLSIEVQMPSSQAVIDKYKQVSTVEGVISL